MSKFVDFIKNIEDRISELVTLRIRTVIGDFKVDENANILVDTASESNIIQTKIDLIQGDITTYMSDELVKEKFNWVRDFHAQKEMKGHEIVNGNIKAILSLFDLYKQTRKVNVNETNVDETKGEEEHPAVTDPSQI